jgi:hypothetical protein
LDLTLRIVPELAQYTKKALACLGQNSTRMGLARFFAKEN